MVDPQRRLRRKHTHLPRRPPVRGRHRRLLRVRLLRRGGPAAIPQTADLHSGARLLPRAGLAAAEPHRAAGSGQCCRDDRRVDPADHAVCAVPGRLPLAAGHQWPTAVGCLCRRRRHHRRGLPRPRPTPSDLCIPGGPHSVGGRRGARSLLDGWHVWTPAFHDPRRDPGWSGCGLPVAREPSRKDPLRAHRAHRGRGGAVRVRGGRHLRLQRRGRLGRRITGTHRRRLAERDRRRADVRGARRLVRRGVCLGGPRDKDPQ